MTNAMHLHVEDLHRELHQGQVIVGNSQNSSQFLSDSVGWSDIFRIH